jgi:hypothetical protein
MSVPIATLLLVVFAILWLRSGRDPLTWVAVWALGLRAAIEQIGASGLLAVRHFQRCYGTRLARLRREVAEA